jgi:hypothetical protein
MVTFLATGVLNPCSMKEAWIIKKASVFLLDGVSARRLLRTILQRREFTAGSRVIWMIPDVDRGSVVLTSG